MLRIWGKVRDNEKTWSRDPKFGSRKRDVQGIEV